MQKQPLIRIIDCGLAGLLILSTILLLTLAWLSRQADQDARLRETVMVQAELDAAAERFLGSLPKGATAIEGWQQGLRRGIVSRNGTLRPPVAMIGAQSDLQAIVEQAQERLAEGARRLSATGNKVDFAMLDSGLFLMARLSGGEGEQFAIERIDTEVLAARLDQLGLRDVRVGSDEREASPGGTHHHMVVIDDGGRRVAVISWEGMRLSRLLAASMLPLLLAFLLGAMAYLLILRFSWRDATQRFIAEVDDVHRQATTDPLTGLANRRALFAHLRVIAPSLRSFSPVTVILMDLDGFKWVNDTHGHAVGDMVIQRVAGAMQAVFAETGMLARLGGDEFAVVLPGSFQEKTLNHLHHTLMCEIRSRLTLPGQNIAIGVSMGVVSSEQEGGDGEDLVKLADLAVYAAKARGRGCVVVYDASLKREQSYRRTLERELRAALLIGELKLHYQPVVHALTEKTMGYEALVRWQHPVRGLIGPAEFIPIAESSDLIVAIGQYVLDRALMELGPMPGISISVNATGRQMVSRNFVATVLAALERYQVDPKRLCLELTETSLIDDADRVAVVMEEMRGHGIRFAIDDFGVGYSSLGYLLRFKFDVLKIDRDFIKALDEKPESPLIVMSIVNLARGLGMQVVGEGIETGEQHRFLASAGCHMLQGFLFGRPLPIHKWHSGTKALAEPPRRQPGMLATG